MPPPLPPPAAGSAPLKGSLFYGTCNLPACDTLEFASYNLATGASTDLFVFPLDSYDDGYVADDALFEDSVVISLQYDSAPDVGLLVTFNLTSNMLVSSRNSTPCFGLWPDVDSPATTLLCLALVSSVHAQCPPGTTSQCSQLLRIDRATGAETLLAAFLGDYAPFTVEALDVAAGLVYSTFELLAGGTPELVTINARTGAVVRTVSFPVSLAFIELEMSAARGKVYAVVQDTSQPGVPSVYAGVVDPTTATATPLGPASYFNASFPPATGGYWNQFNSISTLSDELGVFFSTAFHYEVPAPPSDPVLFLLGNSLDDGSLVYSEVVRNPYCEILWLPSSVAIENAVPPPPACSNLTGWWCCEETNVTQVGGTITTTASYGEGSGTLTGSSLRINFTNAASELHATVSSDCSTVTFDTGVAWSRAAPPWTPSVAAPAWASSLNIIEINTLTYTSPAGMGTTGDGSGTWSSLLPKVEYWRRLGVTGLWLAYYNLATPHFYGVRSVYAATDPPTLDPALGPPEGFTAFVEAAHAAGIKVFLDVIGHGLVNDSSIVAQHPAWFKGGSWGMVDYDYGSADFIDWWQSVWTGWVNKYHVDGVRIDIADAAWWATGVWDRIASAAAASGHEIAVWGESSRYHFSQHDAVAPVNNLTAATLAAAAAGRCLNTLQLSCHDHGWESSPGNYFFLRGSRAQLGAAALSAFIPLWLGGDEYDEDPVIDAPALKKDLYGTSGLPGGWMYGSVRQWNQLAAPHQAATFNDSAAILGIFNTHTDVLAHDACTAAPRIASLVCDPPLAPLDPFVRWLSGAKAILVFPNSAKTAITTTVAVPLARCGFDAAQDMFTVTHLFGGPLEPARVSAAALAHFPVTISPDATPGGGLVVLLIEPTAPEASHGGPRPGVRREEA